MRWDRDGSPKALPPLDDDFISISGYGINARGQVVGDSFGPGPGSFGGTSAVVWTRDGTPMELPPLAGRDASFGESINAKGLVAGTTIGGGFSLAVVWGRDGRPNALPLLNGYNQSTAMAINNSGMVAGDNFGGGPSTAVVWRSGNRP